MDTEEKLDALIDEYVHGLISMDEYLTRHTELMNELSDRMQKADPIPDDYKRETS